MSEPGVEPFVTGITGPIQRHRWTWSGAVAGLPGYSTFYAQIGDAQAFVGQINTFLTACCGTGASSGIPAPVSLVPDGFVDQIVADTGELVGSTAVTPPATITSTNSSAYSAPSGACVTWQTAGVVNGKRVRGRWFMVPIAGNKQDSNGTLLDTFRSQIVTAAQAYVSGTTTGVVWHRPVGGSGGQAFPLTSFTVKDKIAVLTSRRGT